MSNFFSKLWDFLKHLVTRPGLIDYLKKWEAAALKEVAGLAAVHDGESFHAWEEEAFTAVKALTGELKDTWVTILINIVWESIKAKQSAPSQPSQPPAPSST